MLIAFKEWLVEQGRATSTVASYVGDVKLYLYFLEGRFDDQKVILNRFLFTRYKEYLQNQKSAVATVNKKINSLKVFNDYLVEKELATQVYISLAKDQVHLASGSEETVTILTDEEVEKFLFYLEKEQISERNKLIGYLLLYTGMRVSELVQLKLNDIDLLTRTLKVKGKRQKIREIPIRKDVGELIKAYITNERMKSPYVASDYLLLSQRAPKMHRDAVRRWTEKVGKEIKIHLHPHLFRHTFATRLINRQVDIATVSKLCGHASINMTMKFYINISKEQKTSAIEKL